jgi:starch phosphorylase
LYFPARRIPQDQGAKRVLQELIDWQREPTVRQRVAFIEDYDQEIARQMVQGVDVWMNVPRRPQEASGHQRRKSCRQWRPEFFGARWLVAGRL